MSQDGEKVTIGAGDVGTLHVGETEKKWTREEAAAHVLASGLVCRGPHHPLKVALEKARGALAVAGDGEALGALSEITPDSHATTRDATTHLLRQETAASHAAARALDQRTGCGWNVGEAVVAGKFDGKSHTIACPKCGQEIGYTAPWFPGLEDEMKEPEPEAATP